jgi:glycosyltransferase involved in cell wall biosynthesis
MAAQKNTTAAPRVSIILPAYNRAALLRRAIESIRSQSFSDWELIAINDASTDNTREVLDKFAAEDHRIHPIHHDKNYYPDISRTLNEGLAAARGEFIARLDDDDYWCDDEKLARQVKFFESHPGYVVVGGGTIVVDEHDRERFRYKKLERDEEVRDKALFANPFTHSTVMFRREPALAAGGYGDFKNAEDWDLWLAMGARGKFYNFPDYFVHYLMAETSKSFIFKRSQSKEILKIISRHRREYPHFAAAYALNSLQYVYSFLPYQLRKFLHGAMSRMKRAMFAPSQ